ncbi:MAG: iron ABC transporter permease [Eubacteriaceae bacterium]|nr:iron ABC transporter permease [Eubacteriaceae bacterium]
MKKIHIFIFTAISIILILLYTAAGTADIAFLDTFKILAGKLNSSLSGFSNSKEIIILNIRLPRVLLSYISGACLALCGCGYQSVFKNPLSDPFILGVSSGAALGATLSIVLSMPNTFLGLNITALMAFFGAVITVFVVFAIYENSQRNSTSSLLLIGIAIGQFITAVISVLMLLNQDNIKDIYFWTLGSFAAKSWPHLAVVSVYFVIGFCFMMHNSKNLDIMLLGSQEAQYLGQDIYKVRRHILVITSLLAAGVVSVTGIIGFIGLITPHVVRIFTGPMHKKLMVYSVFIGGIFLMTADTIARSALKFELPVGIVTAIFGAPFFIYLIYSSKREVL